MDTKEINFGNNELIENEKATVNYSGYLFKNGSDSVTIVYGFGKSWNNTSEKQMDKTDTGFKATIELNGSDVLNFCFRNSNYEWDNNYGQDFSMPILPPLPFSEEALNNKSTEDESIEKIHNVINDSDLLDEIFNSIQNVESTESSIVSDNKETKNVSPIVENNSEHNVLKTNENDFIQKHLQEYDINNILDEMLESINTFSDIQETENTFEFVSTPEASFENIDQELNTELSTFYTENKANEENFSKVLCDLREINKILDHKAAMQFNEKTSSISEKTDETAKVSIPEFVSKVNLNTEIHNFKEEKACLSKQPEKIAQEELYSTVSLNTTHVQTNVNSEIEEKQKDIAVKLVESNSLISQTSFTKKLATLRKNIKFAFYKLSNILPKLFGERNKE